MRLNSRIAFAFCVWTLSAATVFGQFGPGGPSMPSSPGGYRPPSAPSAPSAPRPGGGYRPGSQPSYPNTNQNSNRPNQYGTQPNQYGTQPGRYTPGQPATPSPYGNNGYTSGQQQYPTTPQSPTQFYNPLYRATPTAPRYPSQVQFGSSPQTRIHTSHVHTPAAQWQQANELARGGNFNRVQSYVDQQLQTDRSLGNLMSAVSTFEQMNASQSQYATYRSQAFNMAQQQIQQGSNTALPFVAVAKFSLEDSNDQVFRNTAQSMRQKFPDHEYTHYFTGIMALKDQDWKAAEQSLLKARELGVPEESIAIWLKMAIDNQRWIWQYAWITLWVLVAWLAGLAVLYAAGKRLSGMTLRAIERSDPNDLASGQRWTRTVYRWLINAAGLYYYLSLPLVLLLSISLPLTIGYALLHVPVLNLWLVAIVLVVSVGSIITAFSGLRACFVSVDRQLPGRPLAHDKHQQLWDVVREVAEHVGTRPVDEIYLTPSADIAVTEQGGFLKRMRDRGRRVLILGVGVLDGFPQQAFRSVLAHEYGHFLNRDTAGGDVALRVNAAMENFADAIVQRGKVRWWHVAVQFLQFYYRLFNRLTFGASRLQEVLADRVAVLAYGTRPMRGGLLHAIRRSLEFERWTSVNIEAMIGKREVAASFFQSSEPAEKASWLPIEAAMHQILSQPTTEVDTHPSPRDRFAYADRIAKTSAAASQSEWSPASSEVVWDLFDDSGETRRELHTRIAELLGHEADLHTELNQERLRYLRQAMRARFDAGLHELRANVLCALGQHDDALQDLDRIIERFPGDGDARVGRITILRMLGRVTDAASELEGLLGNPGMEQEVGLWFLLGELYRDSGQIEKAEQTFTRCLNDEKEFVAARISRALVRIKLDRAADAVSDFTETIREMPYASEMYVDRAIAHRSLGNRGESLRDLQVAIDNDASSPRAHRETARWLAADDARQAMQHAIIACDSMKGWDESLPILLEVGQQTNCRHWAAEFLEQFVARLPQDDREAWQDALTQLRDEAVRQGPDAVSPELASAR